VRFLGVGRKVADCVLLMSLDKVSLFRSLLSLLSSRSSRVAFFFFFFFSLTDSIIITTTTPLPSTLILPSQSKNDIIPIDVHVHQIAQRMYNFRPSSAALPGGKRKASTSGEKIPMTPKLYEEVQCALRERWGEWGGWTQAVSSFLSLRRVFVFVALSVFFPLPKRSPSFLSLSLTDPSPFPLSLSLSLSLCFTPLLSSLCTVNRSSSPQTSPSSSPPSPQTQANPSNNPSFVPLNSPLPPPPPCRTVSSLFQQPCSLPHLLPKPNPSPSSSRLKEEEEDEGG